MVENQGMYSIKIWIKRGDTGAPVFRPARTMRCEHQRAIMPISPALEESTMEEGDPRDVEDGEGLRQNGDAEADEEEEGRKSF